jgi:hypothetical protein
MEMKKTIVFAALVSSVSMLGATTVLAGPPKYTPPKPVPPPVAACTDLCNPDWTDLKQVAEGVQNATNVLKNIKDGTKIVQKAVNADNLIDLPNVPSGDKFVLGNVVQKSTADQYSTNKILGGNTSKLFDISQSATNVINSVTGQTAVNINQTAYGDQIALNLIKGGSGGYDVDLLPGGLEKYPTQSAVNAANLIDVQLLKNAIYQSSDVKQVAINTAVFDSSTTKPKHGYHGKPTTISPNVYDFGQTATNVANSVTVESIDLKSACACGYEVDQLAHLDQKSFNLLAVTGNVSNILQSATNIGNSISRTVPSTP